MAGWAWVSTSVSMDIMMTIARPTPPFGECYAYGRLSPSASMTRDRTGSAAMRLLANVLACNDRGPGSDRTPQNRIVGFGSEREAVGEIVAIPGHQPDGADLPVRQDTENVVLDFMKLDVFEPEKHLIFGCAACPLSLLPCHCP